MHRRNRRFHPAFTLIELLVVVAIIALLIGVLVPALSRGREAARLATSMANMRQITIAAVNYSHHHNDNWPVVPLERLDTTGDGPPKYVTGEEAGDIAFNSWGFGGKTNHVYWTTMTPINNVPIERRPLNPWVYPDLDFAKLGGFGRKGNQIRNIELEIFRCPSDKASYQRGFWAKDPSPSVEISSYDDCGTSYHMNVKWWFEFAESIPDTMDRWRKTKPMFRRGGLGGPSKFVWLYDQTMDVLTHHTNEISREGHHGGFNRSKAAFMDGHVTYLTVDPGKAVTDDYWLLLE
jgi:prepilin-type N-terminal cleavage/methylation domain-containing protein